jgi:hypothetical protein
MKNAKVEEFIVIFPHPILSTVQGEPEYHTMQSIRKLLRANTRPVEIYLGGGALGHLGVIISIVAYAIITPAHPLVNPTAPGRTPAEIDGGAAAQLAAERHRWEEAVITFRTWNAVEQASTKKSQRYLNPYVLKFLTLLWLDFLTPLPETCLKTSLCLMAESLQSIWSTTLRTCARHGIPSSRLKLYSSKLNIEWITQKRE